jgi:hypothetical protein
VTRGSVVASALMALAVLAGCGVPTSGEPEVIAASDLPQALTGPTSPPTQTSPPQPMLDSSRVFLVSPGDVLVPRPREVPTGGIQDRLEELLDSLADGPTDDERNQQLSTALPPDVELGVAETSGNTVTIDISVPAEAPTGWASRRAVAQIVLTATSMPEVQSVLLQLAGEPIEAPLPGGELVARPLTAEDYAVFLTASTPGATAEPPSAVPDDPFADPSAVPSTGPSAEGAAATPTG